MRALIALLVLVPFVGLAQGPFAPGVGLAGTTAIHKDSSIIVDWAHLCALERGWADYSFQDVPASHGVEDDAIGEADGIVVSLGDSGYATFTFPGYIYNGPGPDFALFENAFGNFLELAFVEVSSDGVNFVRFPAISLTPDTAQVDGFSEIDKTNIHNFAGKYIGSYGTPFDLEDLADSTGIDLQSIRNVRVVDVIGALNESYTSFDSQGNQVNDPFPTPFASSGHDLDACGVIHLTPNGIEEERQVSVSVYPNPAANTVWIKGENLAAIEISDLSGRSVLAQPITGISTQVNIESLPAGIYMINSIHHDGTSSSQKLIKR